MPRDLPHGWDADAVFGSGAAEGEPGPAAAPMELRRMVLPAPLMQRVRADSGAAVTLPSTATPAERMAILGGAYILLGFLLILLVLHRARKAKLRG
jgi:hypothetical protein